MGQTKDNKKPALFSFVVCSTYLSNWWVACVQYTRIHVKKKTRKDTQEFLLKNPMEEKIVALRISKPGRHYFFQRSLSRHKIPYSIESIASNEALLTLNSRTHLSLWCIEPFRNYVSVRRQILRIYQIPLNGWCATSTPGGGGSTMAWNL